MTECLSDKERLAWLRLIRSENVGPKTFATLLGVYNTAEKALEALPDLARKGGRKKTIRICSKELAEREMEQTQKAGGRIITLNDSAYPTLLTHISDAPPVISVLGDPEIFSKDSISIVGTRNASANGRKFAKKLAKDLGENSIAIVSGLARGIDTVAHEGSIDTGTIAVVAGGLGTIYPPENKGLFNDIVNNGAVVTERPFGVSPRNIDFPRRNRIISGLSQGVVVVEAATRSGSLITARYALEQGREVFAVPGFPFDPRASGPNRLLKQGATLVTKVEDILEQMQSQYKCNDLSAPSGFSDLFAPEMFRENLPESEAVNDTTTVESNDVTRDVKEVIYAALTTCPVEIDSLIAENNLPAQVVLTTLLELELAGKIERCAGNKVALLQEDMAASS